MIYGQALENEKPTHFPYFWLCNRNANIIKKVWFTSTSDCQLQKHNKKARHAYDN